MRETYGSTMIQALKTVLPVKDKVRAKEKRLIVFTGKKEEGQALLGKLEGSRFKARERFLRAILEAGSLDGGCYVHGLDQNGKARFETAMIFRQVGS